MLQVEAADVRMLLVDLARESEGKAATEALARRAVFDLAPEVRGAAIEALKKRSRAEARPVLLAGLRHPWAPAAEHAADALVELTDRDAVPALEKQRDLPDPSLPYREGGKWYVRELVKVNHLRNCLLCHAPSFNARDPVRGFIPVPGEAIPEVYYARGRGSFVRADVTYFKQDFSLMHDVADHGAWPQMQRFDYLVRKRVVADPAAARRAAPESAHHLALERALNYLSQPKEAVAKAKP
jgi:hypothetical protein